MPRKTFAALVFLHEMVTRFNEAAARCRGKPHVLASHGGALPGLQ